MCQSRAGLCPNECLFHHWYYFYPVLCSSSSLTCPSLFTHISCNLKFPLFRLSSCGCCLFVLRNIVRFGGVSSSPAGMFSGPCDREKKKQRRTHHTGKGNINSSQVIEPRLPLVWNSSLGFCLRSFGVAVLQVVARLG